MAPFESRRNHVHLRLNENSYIDLLLFLSPYTGSGQQPEDGLEEMDDNPFSWFSDTLLEMVLEHIRQQLLSGTSSSSNGGVKKAGKQPSSSSSTLGNNGTTTKFSFKIGKVGLVTFVDGEICKKPFNGIRQSMLLLPGSPAEKPSSSSTPSTSTTTTTSSSTFTSLSNGNRIIRVFCRPQRLQSKD